MPLSLAEIQADKDRMRAEMAMTIRRLEMSVKSLREKAAAQAVEIGRGHEELKRLSRERDERNDGLSQSETKAGELEAELKRHQERSQDLAGKLAEAEKALEAQGARAREGQAGSTTRRALTHRAARSNWWLGRAKSRNLSGELTELRAVRTRGRTAPPARWRREIRASRAGAAGGEAARRSRSNGRTRSWRQASIRARGHRMSRPEDGPETALPGHDASAETRRRRRRGRASPS